MLFVRSIFAISIFAISIVDDACVLKSIFELLLIFDFGRADTALMGSW